jgi:hypothetical protein
MRRVAGPLHRGTHVEHEHSPGIGLFLELLDHPAIGAAGNPPVEIAQVVARQVRPMFGELDAEAFAGRAVHARHEAVDDPAGDEFQVAEGREDGGVDLIGA